MIPHIIFCDLKQPVCTNTIIFGEDYFFRRKVTYHCCGLNGPSTAASMMV